MSILIKYFSFMAVLLMGSLLAACAAKPSEEHPLAPVGEAKGAATEFADKIESPQSPPADQGPQAAKQAASPEGQPPLPSVQTGSTTIPAVQSSYCWDTLGCGDYVGGKALLNGTAPAVINPGDRVSIALDYEPLPSKVSVSEIREDNVYVPVDLLNGAFEAPKKKGVYYYLYEATWLTEDGKYTLNQTSAVFAAEVK
ncbi:hypothetical protein [Paenibacillus sp. S150]|uniref:hypothetical protein n=1 Tax=Paenibacillus sp. S150 TaxID=2749826 RepID=UPI001C55FB15|nr:hypothetical protein [Paenibacillus sp. S150]MBW4080497.1 hypothetical protein [Paenibacillus sp. S150]